MKANAPEKIYIHPDIGGREFLRPWLHRPANNESVEYTRTDAFIERACEWLINHNDYICGSTNGIVKYDMEQLVGDFKNYMKGE